MNKSMFFILISIGITLCNEHPKYLHDKGNGIATSMFGTYIRHKELMIYPFYEFYFDHNAEYNPSEMGYGSSQTDYEGKFLAHEGLIYLAYGITNWLMIECEIAAITATLWKAKNDTSLMPDSVTESGLGDVEGQLRWRYNFEREKIPEFFSYFETVLPLTPDQKIIGTSAWEFKLGFGVTKGFKFGTLTVRTAFEYDTGEKEFAMGEYAIEYLKKINDHIKLFGMFEGTQDEVEFIAECQIHFNKWVYLKIGSGFGITSKATDIAPEIGCMFSIPF